MRNINIGQKVICRESGVIGKVLRFYYPTACEEQTMVETDDGRKYHAPTRTWSPYKYGTKPKITICDENITKKLLNQYGEYIIQFATNHGISINEAMERPICKARFAYFNSTGE